MAIVLSSLLHLLLLAPLLLQRPPPPKISKANMVPLSVQLFSLPKPTAPPVPAQAVTTTQPQATKAASPAQAKPHAVAAPTKQTAKAPRANTAPARLTTTKPARPDTTPAQQATTAKRTDSGAGLANRILNSVAARQQQQARQLSSAEIRALQQKPAQGGTIMAKRVALKPAYAAANVLDVLHDGSFIEKVGDYCYQAKAGADLRRDISSMKPVPCGEDPDEALYHSIMDNIGAGRH